MASYVSVTDLEMKLVNQNERNDTSRQQFYDVPPLVPEMYESLRKKIENINN